MAIRTVVTRGFGNGTFNGTIALVVTRGYGAGAAVTAGTRRQRQIKSLTRSRRRRR
jgi:hypothetical protein